MQPIGLLTLDRNPLNFFAETEQVAFHPGHLVPGIDITDALLLAGRLFSYLDTQITRLGGPDFAQIPINRPRHFTADRPARPRTAYHNRRTALGAGVMEEFLRQPVRQIMRLRSFATTAVLAGVLALGGSATAFAADPTPTTGTAVNSPGVLSGNVIQVPLDVPVTVCGDSINLIGLLNPTDRKSVV